MQLVVLDGVVLQMCNVYMPCLWPFHTDEGVTGTNERSDVMQKPNVEDFFFSYFVCLKPNSEAPASTCECTHFPGTHGNVSR